MRRECSKSFMVLLVDGGGIASLGTWLSCLNRGDDALLVPECLSIFFSSGDYSIIYYNVNFLTSYRFPQRNACFCSIAQFNRVSCLLGFIIVIFSKFCNFLAISGSIVLN